MMETWISAILSAVVNVVILAGIPFAFYALWQRRHGRGLRKAAGRAGLRIGDYRYIGLCAVLAIVAAAVIAVLPPSPEALQAPGSAMRQFAGLGFSASSVGLALLYGMVKTGFAEELLFRGLIAGSLFRRFSFRTANLTQAAIFVVPHIPIVFLMPGMWEILPLVFVSALFAGWVRHSSGSIAGPWLLHGCANVATALSTAVGT